MAFLSTLTPPPQEGPPGNAYGAGGYQPLQQLVLDQQLSELGHQPRALKLRTVGRRCRARRLTRGRKASQHVLSVAATTPATAAPSPVLALKSPQYRCRTVWPRPLTERQRHV